MSFYAAALRVIGGHLRDPSAADREVVIEGRTWHVRKAPRPSVRLTIEPAEAERPVG